MRTRLSLVGIFLFLTLPLAACSLDAACADGPVVTFPPNVLHSGNAMLWADGRGGHFTILLSLSLGQNGQVSFDAKEPIGVDVVGARMTRLGSPVSIPPLLFMARL